MKDMVYGRRLKKPEILEAGTYKGIPYWIISMGTHPCAYLDVTSVTSIDHRLPLPDSIPCHGGITYNADNLAHILLTSGIHHYVGWDYAHYSDYIFDQTTSMFESLGCGQKWTTSEILEEVKDVIEDLVYGQSLASFYSL